MVQQQVQEQNQVPQMSPELTFHFAGFWKRFAAIIVDGLVWLIPGIIIQMIIFAINSPHYSSLQPNRLDVMQANLQAQIVNLTGSLILVLLQWIYFALMESSEKQATLGKMALGIKVTDRNGNRISFARATGRYFAKAIPGVLALFTLGIVPIVWFGMAGWTKKKQAIHDMMVGTYVVNK